MSDFILQMQPWFDKQEADAVYEYMKTGAWITEFENTKKFEESIASYTGAKHCVVVNNGTVSLTLAAIACGVKPGDEVIVPNYTMIATPNSITMLGAKAVFVDVERDTLCMDFDQLKASITPKTKAVMLVTANGRYPNTPIQKFREFCEEHKLYLIEDAAQSLGSRLQDGKHLGTIGHVGSFSFSAPKIISTGQGGALITDDDDIAFKLRRLKDFGRSGGGLDVHESVGFNFKFTDIQAIIGLVQMSKLDARVERKKLIMKKYYENLSNIRQVEFFKQDLINTTPWFIDVLVEKRTELMGFLKSRGIGTRLMYPPINKQEAYNSKGYFEVSELVGTKGLWLPSSNQLSDFEIDRTTTAIKEFYS